jgi:hypothetical protein
LSLKLALVGFVALAVLASACTVPTSQSTQNITTANQTANATSGLSSILPGNFSSILPGNITNILPSDIKAKIEGELNESS